MPFRPRFLLSLFCALLALVPARAGAAVVFSETFADNSRGWTFDPDWEIGPAVGLPGSLMAWYDPPQDHSPGADNGLLGTVIGGSPQNVLHGYWYATSPAIDLSGAPGPKEISFWYRNTTWYSQPTLDGMVEVWNGTGWVTLWDVQQSWYYQWDDQWKYATFDVSGYQNADFRVRFGFNVIDTNPWGGVGVGGWSVDDIVVYTTSGCADADADGYWSAACGGGDCDDSNPSIHPYAYESCNGLDDDCDGEVDEGVQTAFYPDADGDGYGTWTGTPILGCSPPPGYVDNYQDCDDTHATVHPWASELCDSLDNDCNGYVDEGVATAWYLDADGDGYGDQWTGVYACSPVEGRITMGGDCDDTNPAIHPEAPEQDNGIDDNCNNVIDEGFEAQRIRFVRDVPNDQGRQVRVRWRRHLNEIMPGQYGEPTMSATYILYRRVEPGQSLVARAKPEGAAAAALPPGEWDIAATTVATGDTTYQVVVPTLCDSNATGMCRAVFLVRAVWTMNDYYYFYPVDSAPDSGYSVDNIAPGVPNSFTAELKPSGNQLAWSAALPQDWQMFRVYRSADPNFTPGPATLVHSTTATQWTDPAHQPFTYKLTSVDANGNESVAAAATATLAVNGKPLASQLSFAALAPNPFRGSVAVTFDVPRAGTAVELVVHDLAGRRVRTLAKRGFEAGRHTLTWDGTGDDGRAMYPGVYLVRVMGEGRAETRRITLLP